MSAVWTLDLHHTEKLVLLALADNANDEGLAYPSVATLTKKCGLSERSVQSVTSKLVDLGLLLRQERTGRSTLYKVTPAGNAPPQTVHPAGYAPTPANGAPPPPQTVHPTPANGAPITVREPSFEPSPNHQLVRGKRATPRRRCPEDFQITEELREWAKTKAPDVDIDAETEGFRDWEFKHARSDWDATWRGWMRTAQKEGRSNSSPAQKSKFARAMEALNRA